MLFFIGISDAQTVEVNGKVIVDDDEIEGIHVINKTSSRFTITNSIGAFTIPVKLNDTVIFSAIKFKPKEIVVDEAILKSKFLNVYLTELVNELNQVVVGKILTGNLLSDVENSDAKRAINFYDLGIPGYTGKPLTQSQRRLKEAAGLEMTLGGGIGGGGVGLSLNPIINAITGRTKMLKNRVKLEAQEDCLARVKSIFTELLFKDIELAETYRVEFFYFASEDEEFTGLCRLNNDIATYEFLKQKLVVYKGNLQSKKE